MKKLVYNTPHGQLTVGSNGEITLEFENLYMQLNPSQFNEFVSYFNQNINVAFSKSIDNSKSSFYSEIIKNMKKDLVSEFKKLINVPIFSPDDNFDIFDYLKKMKNKQIGVFTKDVSKNMMKVDAESICLN